MESSVLLMGPVGAGKTEAIRSISDTPVVDTEARANDSALFRKDTTTVAMDMGTVELEHGEKLRVYGAPGQFRFDFMWDVLLAQSEAVILLIDHSSAEPAADLRKYLHAIRSRSPRPRPLLIGVTHIDDAPDPSLEVYQAAVGSSSGQCSCEFCNPPILRMDPRKRHDVRIAMIALVAVIEMSHLYPSRECLMAGPGDAGRSTPG